MPPKPRGRGGFAASGGPGSLQRWRRIACVDPAPPIHRRSPRRAPQDFSSKPLGRENPEALVLWVESIEAKEGLIAAVPDRFFTTDHYDGHAMVLTNLETIDVEEAEEVIMQSWRLRAPQRVVTGWDVT